MNVAETLTSRLIGTLFVERGLLSESQIRVALEIQRETGQQLGQILVERFGVSRAELASVVAEQWAEIGRSAPGDTAANESWRRLGDIFVERGFVTPEQLEEALVRQRETGERVGEALVAQGSISKFELAGALAEQASALEEEGAPAPPHAMVVPLVPRLEEHSVLREPAPVAEVEPTPVAEPEPVPVAEVEPTPVAEPEPVAVAEFEAEGGPELVALAEPVIEASPPPASTWEWEADPEPEPETEPEPGPEPALEAEPQPVLEVGPEPMQEAVAMWAAEAEPFAEPDPEPAAPPAPETARDATPVVASMPIGLVLADAQPSFGWVAFASTTTGYRLFQFTGAIPGPGETIDVPELGERVVLRLGRSPLPHDQRTCVFLEQLVRAEPALAG